MILDKSPKDKYNAVYLILFLHGIGVLMPWNMFITIAPSYYMGYKFMEKSADGTEHRSDYAAHFMSYVSLASQIPILLLTLINLFFQKKGGLERRISCSLFVLVVIVLMTLIFTLVDTSHMVKLFFFLTLLTVALLNAANGVYQGSLYGLAANFPSHYTNALILGNNVCGVLVSIVNIITLIVADDPGLAAFFYFLTALLTVSACLGSMFLLQKLEFYNYHVKKTKKQNDKKGNEEGYDLKGINNIAVTNGTEMNEAILETKKLKLYFQIFQKVWIQCFNVWCLYFVTLTVFPVVMVDIKYYSESGKYDFFIPEELFSPITTFLLFNFFASFGSFLANFVKWPSSKWLIVPVVARILFIPLMIFCNFRPGSRNLSVWFHNTWIYISFAVVFSITNGYFSSKIMMCVPRIVEPSKAAIASMITAFFLILGIACGISFGFLISHFFT